MDEADDRPCAVDPARERLLRVLDAVGVLVRGLDDRQVAVGERRERRARETRAVPLATRAADEDRQARPVDASRDDLAPVGDVERERRRCVDVGRVRERQVVDAAAGQRAPAALRRVHERREQLRRRVVRRPTARGEQLVAPDVPPAARRCADPARVRERSARRALDRAGRVPSCGRADAREHHGARGERQRSRSHRRFSAARRSDAASKRNGVAFGTSWNGWSGSGEPAAALIA